MRDEPAQLLRRAEAAQRLQAQAKGSVGQETETYYWLQPISLEGQPQHTQNLSNNNLTNATGTSSLVLTQD
jgi:hypothetical protein